MYQIVKKYWIYAKCWKVNEDAFFSLFGILDSSFNIAPIFVAEKFSLETDAKQKMINEKIVPIGVHAWEKWYPNLLDDINFTE